jgi:hypothetical protein
MNRRQQMNIEKDQILQLLRSKLGGLGKLL